MKTLSQKSVKEHLYIRKGNKDGCSEKITLTLRVQDWRFFGGKIQDIPDRVESRGLEAENKGYSRNRYRSGFSKSG